MAPVAHPTDSYVEVIAQVTENEIWFAKGDLIGAKRGPWGRLPSHVTGDLEIDIYTEDNFVKIEAEVGILPC